MPEIPQHTIEQKLNTIEGMISIAKKNFITQDASSMIFVGWAFGSFYIITFLSSLLKDQSLAVSIISNLLSFAGFIPMVAVLIYYIKNEERLHKLSSQNSYMSSVRNTINYGIIIGFTVVAVSSAIIYNGINSLTNPLTSILILNLYATVLFINGRLAYYKWVSWFSLPMWALALLTAYLSSQKNITVDYRLISAIAFIISSAIPGHFIKYKLRHEKLTTT